MRELNRIKLVQENALGLDYKDFERPTVMRNQSPGAEGSAEAEEGAVSADTEYLDIPAFLRRQAD